MIKIENVVKTYNDEIKIGPFNLEIPKAGITSLIGANGAGKSTLLLMIGRLLKMDEGIIKISNLDISNSTSSDIAKKLTILRQENHFVTRLTVKQLISFGRFPYTHGRLTNEDEEIIDKYIDFLGLNGLENRFIDELSGGQRQRAYVAMVLAQETEYVLLDEPLNNLDISRSVDMMKYLKKACKEFNKTIIMVMHDINFAARYSDYICAMKNGQIIAFDESKKVLDPKILTEIYDTPIEIIDTERGPIIVY